MFFMKTCFASALAWHAGLFPPFRRVVCHARWPRLTAIGKCVEKELTACVGKINVDECVDWVCPADDIEVLYTKRKYTNIKSERIPGVVVVFSPGCDCRVPVEGFGKSSTFLLVTCVE